MGGGAFENKIIAYTRWISHHDIAYENYECCKLDLKNNIKKILVKKNLNLVMINLI
jgi:hypothetical protein